MHTHLSLERETTICTICRKTNTQNIIDAIHFDSLHYRRKYMYTKRAHKIIRRLRFPPLFTV